MGRTPRIQFEGASYHVFSRGNRRERIFRSEDDYAAFEEIMLEAMRWSGVLLFNWSQMPNHLHFNVETPEGNLSEFMQRLQTRYAKYFNRVHRLVGHLFLGRYRARLLDKESYFQEIVRYVELNPYRVKGKPLAALGQWRWSSLRYYLQSQDQWPEGCHTAFKGVLERFGQEVSDARKNLTAFLADGLQKGGWEDFYLVKDRRFIGDEAFIERVKHRNKEPVRRRERNLTAGLGVEELLRCAQGLSGLVTVDLAAAGKGRAASRWRQVVVYVGRKFYRIPVVQLAKVLGRSESAISMMLARSWKQIDEWPETQQFLSALERHCAHQGKM